VTIAGDHPEQGLRVALDLRGVDANVARYAGDAFLPSSRHPIDLAIDVATGNATLVVEGLGEKDAAFVKQLGKQMWKLATQTPADNGGGAWPRRIQRWRGPK
jgi:hypothetical protein